MFADISGSYSDIIIANGELESSWTVSIDLNELAKFSGSPRGSHNYVLTLTERPTIKSQHKN